MSMLKHKLSVLSALVLALPLTSIGGKALAQLQPDSSSQPPANIYPDDVVKNYINACVANASSVLDEASAADMCACTISELEKKYTLEEFAELANNLQNGEVPNNITEIAATCLARIEEKSSS